MSTPRDRRDHRRIEIDIDGDVAFAAYELANDTIAFVHTFVPEVLRGHGVATQLAEAGLAMARREGLAVVPQCSVFAEYMREHPDTQDLLAPNAPPLA